MAITLAVIIVGVALVSKSLDTNTTEEAELVVAADEALRARQQVIEKDSDSDGLKDWQETLWHTDPNSRDSDADGTSDGEEVLASRDPAKVGPDDAYTQATPPPVPVITPYAYSYDQNLGETLTEKVGINLASNYLSAKSKGAYDVSTGAELVGNISSEALYAEIYTDYGLADLKLATDAITTPNAYFSAVDRAVSRLTSSPYKDVEIIAAALQTEDYSKLASLSIQASAYSRVRNDLLAINVPVEYASLHLRAVRAFDTIARSLEDIKERGANDPVLILREISRYQLAISEITEVYSEGERLAMRYTY